MNKTELVKIFNIRYHNLKGIKKYEEVDSKLISGYFDNLLPEYYDLIGKIIIKRNVIFGASYRNGCCKHVTTSTKNNGSFLTICEVHLDECGHSTLFHELGHAMDIFPMEPDNSYSYTKIGEHEALDTTLRREFEPKAKELLDLVLADYSSRLDSELGANTLNTYLANCKTLAECKSVGRKLGGLSGIILEEYKNKPNGEENKARYDALFKEVCDKKMYPFVEKVEQSKSLAAINSMYEVILDLLSSKYDVYKEYKLTGHSPKYYRTRKSLLVQEFFANMFELKVMGKLETLSIVKKLLPKSYESFNKLFTSLFKEFDLKPIYSK